MNFDPNEYGPEVAALLDLDGDGKKRMPLVFARRGPDEAIRRLTAMNTSEIFPSSRAPEAAMSGLWLYFSCFDESHNLSQDLSTQEGSYWHGILHRREPDPANAGYWFRRVGQHPIFPALRDEAVAIGGYTIDTRWDPFAFIEFCERARRRPGSAEEQTAIQIQLAEWQLLFDYCARPA